MINMNFFRKIPSKVASISIEVLSVSIANIGSPLATGSPSDLYHFTSFPSDILKPSFGIMITSAISSPLFHQFLDFVIKCHTVDL